MDYLEFRRAYRNELIHSGKGHDDNPPGRGSGRYAFGSGKRPFQRTSKSANGVEKKKVIRDVTEVASTGALGFGSVALGVYGSAAIASVLALPEIATAGLMTGITFGSLMGGMAFLKKVGLIQEDSLQGPSRYFMNQQLRDVNTNNRRIFNQQVIDFQTQNQINQIVNQMNHMHMMGF